MHTVLVPVECISRGWLSGFDPWLYHLLAIWSEASYSVNANIYGALTIGQAQTSYVNYGLFYWILNEINIIPILEKSRKVK